MFECTRCQRTYTDHDYAISKFCPHCGKLLQPEPPSSQSIQITNRHAFLRTLYDHVSHIRQPPKSACDGCFHKYNFTRLKDFPKKPCLPPINQSDKGTVLFIGTNPRCNPEQGDDDFYRYALRNFTNFRRFSHDGKYVDRNGDVRWLFDDVHYALHKDCLAIVNHSWALGEQSSVAELFMCGSQDANIFYHDMNLYRRFDLSYYNCAEEYLITHLKFFQPQLIISFGWIALQWFQTKFAHELTRNTQRLQAGKLHQSRGYPTRDNIAKFHGQIATISVNDNCVSYVVFSLHPNARKFDFEKKASLFESVNFIVENKLTN